RTNCPGPRGRRGILGFGVLVRSCFGTCPCCGFASARAVSEGESNEGRGLGGGDPAPLGRSSRGGTRLTELRCLIAFRRSAVVLLVVRADNREEHQAECEASDECSAGNGKGEKRGHTASPG